MKSKNQSLNETVKIDLIQMVEFKLGKEEFGIEILKVQEIKNVELN